MSSTERTPLRPIQLAVLWCLALAPALALWAFVSPVGASPDEPAHMAYSWGIATGQNVFDTDGCPEGERCVLTAVDVPEGLIPAPRCHAFDRTVNATCQTPTDTTVATSYMTRYPVAYYLPVGLAMRVADSAGAEPNTVGIIGRLFSGALALTILGPALAIASVDHRRLAGTIIATLTPMTMFMAGSINPTGMEICAAVGVAVMIVASRVRTSPGLVAFGVYAFFWLSLTRPLGFLWAGAAVVFGLLYLHYSDQERGRISDTLRRHRGLAVAGSAATLVGIVWFGFATGIRNTGGGEGRSLPDNAIEELLAIGLRWGGLIWENLGLLGWLDTPMPRLLMVALLAMLVSLVVTAGGDADGHTKLRWVTAGYMAAIVVGIWLIMYRQAFLWQGRYAFAPMAIGLVFWVGAATQATTRVTIRLGRLAWIISTACALWLAARYRYGIARGARFEVPDLDADPQWINPVGSLGTMALFALAVVGVPVLLGRLRDEPDHD